MNGENIMGTTELILIAIALSMDAFAASVCKGLSMKQVRWKDAWIIAMFFGGFQALMPLIGWYAGLRFESAIAAVDHWIAFGLLALIGGRMISEALRQDQPAARSDDVLRLKEVLLLAIATSIDALAAGVTFALLPGTRILQAILLIGAITFVLSYMGFTAGSRLGARGKRGAELAGGVILILIGVKILLEHLGYLT
jgi:putative Mn2+ efflux pump MntP